MRQKSIFYLGTIITLLVLSQVTAGYWYWTTDKTVTVTSGMFSSHYADDGLSAEAYVSATNPSNIQIKTTTTASWGDAYARFNYDTGINNLGGSSTNAKYRAQISWYLSGIFDDNDATSTFIKYTYTLYYMIGSSKIIVGSNSYTVNDANHSFDSTLVSHYVTSTNNVPSGKIVYVRIQFELSASGTSREWDLNSDFSDGANKVI